MQDARTADLLARLDTGIGELRTSEDWTRWLDVQARFHRYSFGNCYLIAAQCPTASQVAAYRAWQGMGRQVRQGERAIWILAPLLVRDRTAESDESGKPPLKLIGFKSVPVFDVAQTDGDELPTPVRPLAGADHGERIAALREVARKLGFAVQIGAELPSSRNGDCSHAAHQIRTAARLDPNMTVKTLCHEIAHAILHGADFKGSRAVAEIEAESTAYVVGQIIGLETSSYSFGYVSSWAGNDPETARTAIRSLGQRIAKAAQQIAEGIGAPQPAAMAA
ncbi:MAG: ArdC-like ssDNA-binding domain-containing protein [Candidatus Dormibacteria bacterium]